MFNGFQWNCFKLFDTCNIALILFLKCDVTKLSHNLTLRQHPSAPLNVWRNYLWMPPDIDTDQLTPFPSQFKVLYLLISLVTFSYSVTSWEWSCSLCLKSSLSSFPFSFRFLTASIFFRLSDWNAQFLIQLFYNI